MMFARIAFLAATLLATAATAQITPDQARAHADALIDRAEADAWFINVSEGDVPRVRHVPSGMTCAFPSLDQRNVITLYPTQAGGPAKGDDVGCAAWWDDTYISVIATRYPQAHDQEMLFDSAVGDIMRSWDDAKVLAGEYEVTLLGDQVAPSVAAMSGSRNGHAATNVLLVRNVGAWSFKARGTAYPGGDAAVRVTSTVFAVSLPGGWEAFQAERED